MLKVIKIGGFRGTIVFNLDCNYSAEWCYTAKDLFDKRISPFRSFGIEIWCATDRYSTVDWGEYRRKWDYE